ncbi:MAG: VCBS repeat-containing protein, partial [Trichodesmium erythraeum GBRTRLIN201]|nr:VCBS repeat-containing protein [Trichodesmium erythraeum GBRTRLIN201]
MAEFSKDDNSYYPGEPDPLFPETNYHPGTDLDPEIADPIIQCAWGEVRDQLADFILAPELEAHMEMAFGETVDSDMAKNEIQDILTGENLPDIQVLPAADMDPVVGGFDSLTGTIYLADSLWLDTCGAEDGVLEDVLLEELGHFLDSQLSESDSPGDEGELWAGLVKGEELTESEVLRLRAQDDRVEIWVWGILVEVEATQEVYFERVGDFPVGDEPKSVAVEDFNGDGIPDLAVANYSSDNVSVLLGKGDGSFGSATNFPVGDEPISVAVEDFNGDGIPDLAVANYSSDNVSVLPGKGDGSFGSTTNFPVGSLPRSVTVEDFNGDGISDLAVANSFSDNVSVLSGKGDGTFGSTTNFRVGNSPKSVTVEDFNGDGISDLAVANTYSDNVSVLLGKGDGTFGSTTNFPVGDDPLSVAVEDFNGDGIPDLAVANYSSYNLLVLFGKGDGSFGLPTNFQVGDGPYSVAARDFNADGIPDLAVANYWDENVSVLFGKGDGSFGSAINFQVGDGPYSVAVEDFNADGIPDLAVANYWDDNVSILINTPINITISPLSTTSLEPGKSYTLEWTDNFRDEVKLELYKDNFLQATISSSTPSDGSFSWTVPTSLTSGSNYNIKMTKVNDSSIYDYSNNFTIEPNKEVNITFPSNFTSLQTGQSYDIQWTDNIDENVKLELYKGGSFNSTISSSTESDGSYSWAVPTSVTTGSDYQVKITSISDSSLSDFSNSNFTIKPEDFITVSSPDGGNTLELGKTYTINWSDNIDENVKLELYKAGSFFGTISSSTASNGSYSWAVPTSLTTGNDYQVKITSISDSSLSDFSNSNFTIK